MSMNLRIELWDTLQQRIAVFSEAISLEATHRLPDKADTLECALPHVDNFGPGCTLKVYVNNTPMQCYTVTDTRFHWDADFQPEYNTRPPLRDVMHVQAEAKSVYGNAHIRHAYINITLEEAFLDSINRVPGPVHYLIEHDAYPDGAIREYEKMIARCTSDNALQTGSISEGQWVGADRIDASDAYAKDGDTISGLKVDGILWPDVRLMMIDTEETSLNNHTYKRHPETTLWSSERYENSGYKVVADRAKAFLQQLLDTKGISHIELNPHRNSIGAFDDRVDAYGRYIGRVFGNGECFSAALVEQGLADVYLYEDGSYLVPEHHSKDFFSYTKANTKSYPSMDTDIHALDLDGDIIEVLTLLAYLCEGKAFFLSPEMGVTIKDADLFDHEYRYAAHKMEVVSGFTDKDIANTITLSGNPLVSPGSVTLTDEESSNAYGKHGASIEAHWLGNDTDKQRLATALLQDVAYPAPAITVTFFEGAPELQSGDLVSITGAPLDRYARKLSGEWGNTFETTILGRVAEVRHFMKGKDAWTQATLSAPLRSIAAPLTLLRRIGSADDSLFALRLDEALAGLDQEVFYLR